MKQRRSLPGYAGKWCGAVLLAAASLAANAQQQAATATTQNEAALSDAVRDLQEQVRQLRAAVAEVRSESAEYRADAAELRRELQATRAQVATPAANALETTPTGSNAGRSLAERVASLEESSQLLSGKTDTQDQIKVESASKYRVRLSGLVLVNLFSNRGTPENQDFPSYATEQGAFDPKGSFGATLRQSEVGLEVFGPKIAGASTSGNFQADFAGGFPGTSNGVNSGIFRLRVASMHLDWARTSVVVGQDNLFISPLSPTSFASLAIPALAYAGNTWGWTPQVRVQHRFDLTASQSVTVQAGILDNLTGEPPYARYSRTPEAGERSSQPAYGLRIAWQGRILDRPMSIGTAGYYSRQDWGFNRHVDGWAGMSDWELTLMPKLILSGEFYRGRGVGGIGGGLDRSALYSGSILDPNTRILGLDSAGGWSQLKLKATDKLEFNGAYGLDSPFANDIRAFPFSQSYVDPTIVRNQASLVNFVYRPRSNLLFSTEFRRLRTFYIDNNTYTAQQVNMVMGVLF